MRVFRTKPFVRLARKHDVSDATLLSAAEEIEKGIIDVDLGGGLVKKRIARKNEGKSGGYRSVAAFTTGERIVFILLFAKSGRENLTAAELKAFKSFAGVVLDYDDEEINKAVGSGAFVELLENEHGIEDGDEKRKIE